MLARSRERSRNFSTRRIYIYIYRGPYFLIAIFNARKENNARWFKFHREPSKQDKDRTFHQDAQKKKKEKKHWDPLV